MFVLHRPQGLFVALHGEYLASASDLRPHTWPIENISIQLDKP